jgi:hypothetical protein
VGRSSLKPGRLRGVGGGLLLPLVLGACEKHESHVAGTGADVPAQTPPSTVAPSVSTEPSSGGLPGPTGAPTESGSRPVPGATTSASLRHGTWVYGVGEKGSKKPLSESDPGGAKLLAFATSRHLSEIYLSTGTTPSSAAPLADARTPALVSALKGAGLRVEALMGSKDVHKAVRAVLDYNARQGPPSRFDGVHYDLEPWIGRGSDTSWVQSLVDTYREAQRTLSGTGLSFAADIASAKFVKLSPGDQKALLDSASRLILMAYEVPIDTVHRQYDAWISGGGPSTGSLMIALRVQDFAGSCQNASALSSLDAKYGTARNYAGWATYAYNKYLDPSICTSADCCATP